MFKDLNIFFTVGFFECMYFDLHLFLAERNTALQHSLKSHHNLLDLRTPESGATNSKKAILFYYKLVLYILVLKGV